MIEIDSDIAMPVKPQTVALTLAQSFYDAGGIGKRTAARLAIDQLGKWRVIEDNSAIDYLRQRIIGKHIHGPAR